MRTTPKIKNHGTKSPIATAIKRERKKNKLTQSELGLYAGVGINFIYELEKGKSSVRFDKLLKVLKVLGLQLKIEFGQAEIIE